MNRNIFKDNIPIGLATDKIAIKSINYSSSWKNRKLFENYNYLQNNK